MAKQHVTAGAFLEIDLGDGHYAYARILEKASYAFYDLHSSNKITDLNLIARKPILFIIAVYNTAVNSGRWVKIGKKPLEKWLEILPNQFVQDALHPDRYSLYDPNNGAVIEADRENCVGLERAAVWEAQHVESRIKDHYADKPNSWVEQLRLT